MFEQIPNENQQIKENKLIFSDLLQGVNENTIDKLYFLSQEAFASWTQADI